MTSSVDYDRVAASYDRRFKQEFGGTAATIRKFVAATPQLQAVVEVGCGTGHWLAGLGALSSKRVGVDFSSGMLSAARVNAPGALLVRATAERLPLLDHCVDAVLCINAVHHFADPDACISEVRRILRPGGRLLVVGLDPHIRAGRWWIYETFPSAQQLDRERYPSTQRLRAMLERQGFCECTTTVAEEIHAEVSFSDALERGDLDRRSTSQLMVIPDAEYEDGMKSLHATRPVLHADLTLYATVARAA